jgi:hypothetical protein
MRREQMQQDRPPVAVMIAKSQSPTQTQSVKKPPIFKKSLKVEQDGPTETAE